ncbi:uncharacterized protein A1O5_06056 [Cladophialophora psammophila CBS 110553]|uniref:Uncharacterized protein n=1 Tax=Cladophialophora psammophila CBS 110553 TaxID=1182543 RepID=W9WT00_9EURO|nr:uncharacterized protein A1O5_06056 [Cladophialophora psammophila CBS 110553]EXJ71063.1 hypothetical protein A1O5_06056 [Cladophialophora psammophila CBS 110553]
MVAGRRFDGTRVEKKGLGSLLEPMFQNRDDEDRERSQEEIKWRVHVSQVLRGRVLIYTEGGRLGLVPGNLMVGYEVCVILGCSVPVIMAELNYIDDTGAMSSDPSHHGKPSGHHILWCECFIDGMMDGEMIEELGGEENGLRMIHGAEGVGEDRTWGLGEGIQMREFHII